MKKILFLSIILFVALIIYSPSVFGLSNEDFEYEIWGDILVEITKYIGKNKTEVIIPDKIDNYSVTRIGDSAFNGCTGLASIAIPNSVERIGDSAFAGCTGLVSIAIPNSVTQIGDFAFSGCTGLASIVVDKGNKVYDSRNNSNAIIETSSNKLIVGCKNTLIPNSVMGIGYSAFAGCTELANIVIPNSVTQIESSAFAGCTELANIVIPNSVTQIGNFAFDGCTGLVSMVIPNSVTQIGDFAFSVCTGLASIVIPNSVTQIGNSVFDGCTGLASIVVDKGNRVYDSRNNSNAIIEISSNKLIVGCNNTIIPSSVTSIEEGAFLHCTELANIVIPNSVTQIGNFAFAHCTGLASIVIPNSVTQIGDYAFYDCTGLTNITIPRSVKSIGKNVFRDCDNLTIYGYKGSDAEMYAKEYNIKFVEIKQVLGDISRDGKVDAFDAYKALELSVSSKKPIAEQLNVLDIDKNGKVDAYDAYLILAYSVGIRDVMEKYWK